MQSKKSWAIYLSLSAALMTACQSPEQANSSVTVYREAQLEAPASHVGSIAASYESGKMDDVVSEAQKKAVPHLPDDCVNQSRDWIDYGDAVETAANIGAVWAPAVAASETCAETNWGNLTFDHGCNEKMMVCKEGFYRKSQRYTGTDDPCTFKLTETAARLQCCKPGKSDEHDADHTYITCCKKIPAKAAQLISAAKTCFNQRLAQPLSAAVRMVDVVFAVDGKWSLSSDVRDRFAEEIAVLKGRLPDGVETSVFSISGEGSPSDFVRALNSHAQYRAGAALVLVYVSDKSDVELDAQSKALLASKGAKPVVIARIVAGESKIAKASYGLLVDLKKGYYVQTMDLLGGALSRLITLRNRLDVPHVFADFASLTTKVDGKQISFSRSGQQISWDLSVAGRAGSVVDVHYCIQNGKPVTRAPIVEVANPSCPVIPEEPPVVEPPVTGPSTTPPNPPVVEPPVVQPPVAEPSTTPPNPPVVEPPVTPPGDPAVPPTDPENPPCTGFGCDGGSIGVRIGLE